MVRRLMKYNISNNDNGVECEILTPKYKKIVEKHTIIQKQFKSV
jgi:hypothetical protein